MRITKALGFAALALTTNYAHANTLNIDSATDWGNGHASYPASNTIDGSLAWASRWAASGSPVNLQLNLDSVQNVTEVGISWGKGGDQTHTFEIWARAATSGDWTKVYDSVSTGSTSSIEVYDIDDIQAQQVRVKTFSNSAGSNWTNIKEVELYGSGGNDADGELSVSRAFDDGTGHANYPASKAIDDNTAWSSRWAAEAGGSAVNLTLELDEAKEVKDVAVAWGQGNSRTHTFEIYARPSTSGAWTKVHDSVSSGNSTSLEVYDVTDTTARQVRIKAQSNSAGSDWMNITEVKLYGADDDVGSGNDIPSIITDGSLFDLEGDNPHPLVNSKTLAFVPLETKYTTSGGGGWRHEYKIKTSERKAMYSTYETFSATYKMDLSNGAKTIVAQTHGSTISTLMKVYVADSSESGFIDSVANNGIFDVYVRLRGTDGNEVKTALGTITSGGSFDLSMVNNYGTMTITAFGVSAQLKVENDEATYLKFGNYMQSQDPVTREECGTRGDSDSWAECFEEFGITTSKATVTDVSYTSNH
ncbi:discoidin domain-containing protein [Algibacillus agarilyticus]|uniref:discoidin domain-containing protein n=1 Tax=Algibacillus agarilyticus TaxID=2234133 RepID=UPI001E2DB62A|nr:discoidin domain-containing protein [Algibacillus agarilyticus]